MGKYEVAVMGVSEVRWNGKPSGKQEKRKTEKQLEKIGNQGSG